MFYFTSLNRKIWVFNQFLNESKEGANRKAKAMAIAMFFVMTGVTSATAATTTIANSEASSTTISWRPRPAPPNREGSDDLAT